MDEAYARDDRPPKNGPSVQLLRVTSTELHTFVILSHTLVGYWTHWDGRRTTPCTKKSGECPGCNSKHPDRWKGYLHVWHAEGNVEAFLELTPAAAESVTTGCQDPADLRGERIQVQRSRGGPKGRLSVRFLQKRTDPADLPAQRIPLETLHRLWTGGRGNGTL